MIILTGSATTLVLVRLSTEKVYRSLVFSGDSAKARVYATILAEYYAQNRGWTGVGDFLAEIPRQVSLTLDLNIRGMRGAAEVPGMNAYPYNNIQALLADRIALADLHGVIIADSSGKLLGSTHPAMHLAHGYPIIVDFGRVGTVLVGSMIDSSLTGIDERFLSSITTSLLMSTLASSLLALVLGLLFAARLTKPLAGLSSAARRVAAGELPMPVPVRGADEVAELALSFNAMTEELLRLEDEKKRIIADAAHELRTPVTLIQGTIEAMLDGIYPLDRSTLESVHEETIRLSHLIDTLRELELIDSGELDLEFGEVDLLELARKAIPLFASQAASKGITLTIGGSGAASVKGDQLRLGEVLYNLLSNAIKYSPSGSRVHIGIEVAGGSVRLAVEDSGPGIPEAERKRIFERFYRIDRSRAQDTGGRGLGLAIAQEIVKAHRGSIEVLHSDLGGAAFIVRLPAMAS
ncbi:MAG: ATP-binding protein [Spirochaetota bacterium]